MADLNSNPWGDAYRIVSGKFRVHAALSEEAQLQEARKLFPVRPRIRWPAAPVDPPAVPILMDELRWAVARTKTGKAPGPDGISAEMVKLIFSAAPTQCLDTMNACITNGLFPNAWKIAELRLIPKLRKPGQRTTKYRPICLLSIFGKVLEKIIKDRLTEHTEPLLSTAQYGFRPGKSTADAVRAVIDKCRQGRQSNNSVILVALDIRNAFNAARWDMIRDRLEKMDTPKYIVHMIQSYFESRKLKVGATEISLTCGVPQGSVLGPLLWNILYEEVVSLKILNCDIIAYADDLVAVIQGSNTDIVLLSAELAMRSVSHAMTMLGVTLAAEKTEAMIWCGPTSLKELSFDVQGHKITTGNSLKYLGVWLERNGRCTRHTEEALLKAERRVHSLSRLTRIDGPVRYRARRMYGQVILSGLLYCVSAWGALVRTKKEKRKLASASRLALLRICSAPSMVSTAALEVISGIPPITLRIKDQVAALPGQNLGTEWQRLWQEGNKGHWTRTLIPRID